MIEKNQPKTSMATTKIPLRLCVHGSYYEHIIIVSVLGTRQWEFK